MRPPTPPPTAAAIAAEYYAEEIALHQESDLQSETVVIIQDACYGHRFSRPGTTKAGLQSIVERPERMRAAVLGLSAAYVRAGKRHDGGRFAPHPDLDTQKLPIPPFQIRKTSRALPLSSAAVTHVHGVKWMEVLKGLCDDAESRLALNGKELVRPSSSSSKENGSANGPPVLHEGDLYLCSESLDALEGALGGVCEAVDHVFGPGTPCRAFVNIRPPGHHCSSDYPSGFCWLNNVHVGIAHAAMTHDLTHAAILDFDLHHGDGSQSIAWEQNSRAASASKNAAHHKKTSIGYFSLHDINSYPCENGEHDKICNASICIDGAHNQSIWNVHLESWKTVQDFWKLYNTKYAVLIEKARTFLRSHTEHLLNSPNSAQPKAAIFISAGFDASEWEGEGMQRHKVNVPTDFYARFTADVVRLSQEEGLGVDGRIVSVLEGGYSDRALTSGVLSHLSALVDTRSYVLERDAADQGHRLASEMTHRLDMSDESNPSGISDSTEEHFFAFDSEWWSPTRLEELEKLRPKPLPPLRKVNKHLPAYALPTEASTAKSIESVRKRLSGYQYMTEEFAYERQPLPAVDWATSAYELSKILIPTDRTTTSHEHAELKGQAAHSRQQRLSANSMELETPATNERGHMQLRERKPKASPATEDPRPMTRASRRTTIASMNDLSEPAENPSQPPVEFVKPPLPERLSVASSAVSTTSTVRSTNPRKPRQSASSRQSSKGQEEFSRSATSMSTRPAEAQVNRGVRPALGARAATSTGIRSNSRRSITPGSSRGVDGKLDAEAGGSSSYLSADTNDSGNPDMDTLTHGVKKLNIKLKLPTPEQHYAKIKALEETKNTKKQERPKGQTLRTSSGKCRVSDRSGKVAKGIKQEENASDSVSSYEASLLAVTPENESGSEATQRSVHGRDTLANGENSTLPSSPLTPELPRVEETRETISSQPSNTTHQATYGKGGLPVFTPTSVIPFASSSPPPPSGNQEATK